jgi:hypothetical protein
VEDLWGGSGRGDLASWWASFFTGRECLCIRLRSCAVGGVCGYGAEVEEARSTVHSLTIKMWIKMWLAQLRVYYNYFGSPVRKVKNACMSFLDSRSDRSTPQKLL